MIVRIYQLVLINLKLMKKSKKEAVAIIEKNSPIDIFYYDLYENGVLIGYSLGDKLPKGYKVINIIK